jgi:hypothetical protein
MEMNGSLKVMQEGKGELFRPTIHHDVVPVLSRLCLCFVVSKAAQTRPVTCSEELAVLKLQGSEVGVLLCSRY